MASVWVEIDQRKFLVKLGADGTAFQIVERMRYGTPPYDGWRNKSYWHFNHHKANPGTLPARIIEAAKVKHAAS